MEGEGSKADAKGLHHRLLGREASGEPLGGITAAGTGRLLALPLVRELLQAGAGRDRLSYRALRTLAALDPAVAEVNGYSRYRIEGSPTDANATVSVLDKGGILCVNVGDATRTLNGSFQCYLNHARVAEHCERIGFQSLVPILWRKPTNKPNAFLGSGFFPPNAYVTLDCEYILVFRKGGKRVIKPQDPLRYASQYSKAERDVWFSQTWDLRGARQNHAETAPFPEELPYRLIRMFSCIGDTVLDPFLGTGTTVKLARLLGRKGIGYEMNSSLKSIIDRNVDFSPARPEEVVDYLFRIYDTAQDAPTVLVTSKTRNLSDKSLSSFR